MEDTTPSIVPGSSQQTANTKAKNKKSKANVKRNEETEKNEKSNCPNRDLGIQHSSEKASFKGSSQPQNASKQRDLKSKINRLKDKLSKISLKCNEANAQVVLNNSSRENSSRRRAISERSVGANPDSQDCSKRSQSFSVSTEGGNLIEMFGEGPSSRKKMRGRRGSKRRGGQSSDVYSHFPNMMRSLETDTLQLNAETFLILDLLYLPAHDRENFITKVAQKLKILLKTEDNGPFVMNPCLKPLASILPYENRNELLYFLEKRCGQTYVEVRPRHVVEKDISFDEYINEVIKVDLSIEQQMRFHFPETPIDKRHVNYYNDDKYVEKLENFAQKCVEANLGRIVEQDIRVNAKNNDQAFIKIVDGERDAMFPIQVARKYALHGDIVRAFVRTSEQVAPVELPSLDDTVDLDDTLEEQRTSPARSSKAFVIKILQHVNPGKCVGNFLSYRKNAPYITFVPRDMRMPHLKIYQEHWPEAFATGKMETVTDNLYLAEIVEWKNEICIGKVLQPIGKCGELESENKAILIQNNLSMEPYDEKFNTMFAEEYKITDEEIKKRTDLRSECIFSIDPLTARDLDDAMSCKQLPDGNFEVGVHISDVSFFLEEESELDKIVKTRTTSVYMVNEVFHMLPKPLCFRCSLLPSEDKLTFSVIWVLKPTGEILFTRFLRTVINSCTQLAYEHAQKIIDHPEKEFQEMDFPQIHNGFTPSDIVQRVKNLNAIATLLRQSRFDNGALKIDKPRLHFDLDSKTGEPITYELAELKTANFLIEEFMLLANQSVADFIYKKYPEISILRNHEPPEKTVLKTLKERLQKLGMNIDVSTSKTIYASLLRLIEESDSKDAVASCLSVLFSKPMKRANYFCSEATSDPSRFWHFALSIPIYTHFTSPIRRYPDVLVHRVLSAALDYNEPPKRTPQELQEIAELCNKAKYSAKLAGDDSANLYFLHYVQSKKSLKMRSAVLDIFNFAIEVILIDTGHQIRVSFRDCKDMDIEMKIKDSVRTVRIAFKGVANARPLELKMLDLIWVDVMAEKKKLKGKILPP